MRRKAKRTTRIACYKGALGLGKNIALSVLDLSETGLCLLVNTAMAQGEELEVNLMALSHRHAIKVLAEVVWSVEAKDGVFCVGAKFRSTVPYREIQEMGSSPY
jgi:hypothetical protein